MPRAERHARRGVELQARGVIVPWQFRAEARVHPAGAERRPEAAPEMHRGKEHRFRRRRLAIPRDQFEALGDPLDIGRKGHEIAALVVVVDEIVIRRIGEVEIGTQSRFAEIGDRPPERYPVEADRRVVERDPATRLQRDLPARVARGEVPAREKLGKGIGRVELVVARAEREPGRQAVFAVKREGRFELLPSPRRQGNLARHEGLSLAARPRPGERLRRRGQEQDEKKCAHGGTSARSRLTAC